MQINTPEQKEAIRKMMAKRRRELSYQSASFPKFTPGMTTANYLRLFAIGRPFVLPFGPRVLDKRLGWICDLSRFERPAPMLDPGIPEVTEETVTESTDASPYFEGV